MPKDVFISYSNEDKSLADRLCQLLEQRGVACWIAPRDIHAGAAFDEAILDAIDATHAMVLVLSAQANKSPFVKGEVNRAFTKGNTIFTFRIQDVLPSRALELYLARQQWTDGFTPPLEATADRLAASIRALLGRSTPAVPAAPQEDPRSEASATTPAPGTAPQDCARKPNERSSQSKLPTPPPATATGHVTKADRVYLTRGETLATAPDYGHFNGRALIAGTDLEFLHEMRDGFFMVRNEEGEERWVSARCGSTVDPRHYFTLDGTRQGYLVGTMYPDNSGGNLDYVNMDDSEFGPIKVEISHIASIEVRAGDRKAPIKITTDKGATYTGTSTGTARSAGASHNTYVVIDGTAVCLDRLPKDAVLTPLHGRERPPAGDVPKAAPGE